MGIKIWIGLLLCNTFWSLNPLAGKVLLEKFPPLQVVFFRYVSAFVFAFLFWCGLKIFKKREAEIGSAVSPVSGDLHTKRHRTPFSRLVLELDKEGSFYFWLGVLTLFPLVIGPYLQASGLQLSRATDNALIIAIEPLITLFLAAIFLRQRLKGEQWISLAIALCGFWFLSDLQKVFFESPPGDVNLLHSTGPNDGGNIQTAAWVGIGNLLILISLIGEGLYSVAGTHLLKKIQAVSLFTLALFLASIVHLVMWRFHPDWKWNLEVEDWIAVIWLGPIGTTFTYIFWLFAMRAASVPQMALTLYLQPVLGAVWGAWLLKESLSTLQWFGGLLILFGIAIPFFHLNNRTNRKRREIGG